MQPGLVCDLVSLAACKPPTPELESGRPSGLGAVGSPLRRAVRLNKTHEGWGGQGLGGEDASLQLETEAAEGVSAERDLGGLCVHNLAAWPHGAGGQRHCGAGRHGAQGTAPGTPSCQSPSSLGPDI